MKNFIEEYCLSDISLCDDMIRLFIDGNKKGLTAEGKFGSESIADTRIKKSTDFWLKHADKVGKPQDYRWEEYHKELNGFIDQYFKTYKFDVYGGKFVMRHLPQIQYYKPGEGYYSWHIDASQLSACDRAMVFITYLNDVTDGGGTMFYHQEYTTKAEKGKTIIFPAGYTHLHKGEISETQEKYILTGWLWWA